MTFCSNKDFHKIRGFYKNHFLTKVKRWHWFFKNCNFWTQNIKLQFYDVKLHFFVTKTQISQFHHFIAKFQHFVLKSYILQDHESLFQNQHCLWYNHKFHNIWTSCEGPRAPSEGPRTVYRVLDELDTLGENLTPPTVNPK